MLKIKDDKKFQELIVTQKEQLLLLINLSVTTKITTQVELVQEYLTQTLPPLHCGHEKYRARINHRSMRKKTLITLWNEHIITITT
jgi:hypothetical protein